ncbi:MAG: hypothetical protein ACLSHX_04660 [Suilimivivens sp.]
MKKKKLLATVLTSVMVLSLTACGSGGKTETSTTAADSGTQCGYCGGH